MKIEHSRQSGHTLFVVMMLTGIIIAALGTYLNLASQEQKTLRRSYCWNAALPMAEAGVEEALSHINQDKTNYASDGWGTNVIRHRGLADDYYNVGVAGRPGSTVTITSTGFVHVADANYISRIVQVKGVTARDFRFPGLVANNINFGGTFTADSYDSSTNTDSTNGQYDPKKATAGALIATPSGFFNLQGNTTIRGYIASGPGGTYSCAGSASASDGSLAKGVQMSPVAHFTNGFTINLPPVDVPFTDGDLPQPGNVLGTNYDYVLDTDNYYVTNFISNGAIYIKGSASLYVTGLIGLNQIVIAPNARLDLFLASPSITIHPVVIGAAPFFTIFALPTCHDLTMNNGTQINGLIYAPNTILSGAGHASICGAIAANTFGCQGTFDFHYDLAFNKPRYLPPVRVISWSEL
jgi:hypothetical protein